MDQRKFARNLSALVRDLRADWGVSQEQFAKILDLSQATVVKLEKKRYEKLPEHKTLLAIASAINVDYWEFIGMMAGQSSVKRQPPSISSAIGFIQNTDSLDALWKIQEAVVERSNHLR